MLGGKSQTHTSVCMYLIDSLRPHGLQPTRLLCHGDSPGKNTGVGCHTLLRGNFPTQGPNPGLLHCRWIIYHLSHQGSPNTYLYTCIRCYMYFSPSQSTTTLSPNESTCSLYFQRGWTTIMQQLSGNELPIE